MAPTIPVDYAGQRESKKFSKPWSSGNMMGKTRKISKGYSTGFVPDYRHVVEAVAESDGFGSSDRVDAEFTALEDSCIPSRKSISLNVDGYDSSVVPYQFFSLSKMSRLEKRDLKERFKGELEQVRRVQRKIATFSLDTMVHPPATDVHSYQNLPSRPAIVESLPMSANDSRTTPGKKKGHPGRNGTRTKGGHMAPKRNEPVKQALPQNASFVTVMKQCETLLSRLMTHPHGWIFNEPVDIVKHNIPDYFKVIKHPMDLGTIKSKLLSGQYSSPMEFAADVRLTFSNAMTYNPPKHDVHIMAGVLSKIFEQRWKQIMRKIPQAVDEPTASKSSVIIEPEFAYVPPAKKQRIGSQENKVKHERERQPMTDLEKQRLGAELEDSITELPDHIIDFLKQSTLKGSQVSEDEIEIDIDDLSDDTLLKIRNLLDDYQLEKRKNQSIAEPCEIEAQKESGFSNLSVQPNKDNEPVDEYVDIGGDDTPPVPQSPPLDMDKDSARRNSNCSSSTSSIRESGSSSSDTESGSSASQPHGDKNSAAAPDVNDAIDSEVQNSEVQQKENKLGHPKDGDLVDGGQAEQNSISKFSLTELSSRQEGDSALPERQVSPEKQYRAALLRSRFADIIIKAQENNIEKGERTDSEKLKLEREDIERRRKEEKARLQAEAKAAEEARKRIELESAAEAKRKREVEREAARQALLEMEKTVNINENSHFMEDLEMFTSAPDEDLRGLIEEASPETSQNGLGSFKFGSSSNPLEQLGLYMKNDEEEEEDVEEPYKTPDAAANDPEEGEID